MATINFGTPQQQPPQQQPPQQQAMITPPVVEHWNTQRNRQKLDQLHANGELQAKTMMVYVNDGDNEANKWDAMEVIESTGKKCGRVYDIMEALEQGPKTRNELQAHLVYENYGTHYMANPLKVLRDKGYVYKQSQPGVGEDVYYMTAYFAFGL